MSDITSQVELNDSDILAIEAVAIDLGQKQGTPQNLEGFRQEIVGKFEKIGLKVDVRVYETNESGTYAFDIHIEDRLWGEFDLEKMVYEATHDVLDLGEGGVITAEGVKDAPLVLHPKKGKGKKKA